MNIDIKHTKATRFCICIALITILVCLSNVKAMANIPSRYISYALSRALDSAGRNHQPALIVSIIPSNCTSCDLKLKYIYDNMSNIHPDCFVLLIVNAHRKVEANRLVKYCRTFPKILSDDGSLLRTCGMNPNEEIWLLCNEYDSIITYGSSIDNAYNMASSKLTERDYDDKALKLRLISSAKIIEQGNFILINPWLGSINSSNIICMGDNYRKELYLCDIANGRIIDTIIIDSTDVIGLEREGYSDKLFLDEGFSLMGPTITLIDGVFKEDTSISILGNANMAVRELSGPRAGELGMRVCAFQLKYSIKKRRFYDIFAPHHFFFSGQAFKFRISKQYDDTILVGNVIREDTTGNYDSLFALHIINTANITISSSYKAELVYKNGDLRQNLFDTYSVKINDKVFSAQCLSNRLYCITDNKYESLCNGNFIDPALNIPKAARNTRIIQSQSDLANNIKRIVLDCYISGMAAINNDLVGVKYNLKNNVNIRESRLQIYDASSMKYIGEVVIPVGILSSYTVKGRDVITLLKRGDENWFIEQYEILGINR